MKKPTRALVISAATLGVVLVGGMAYAQVITAPDWTVVRVVDGDTLVASQGDQETKIRLLNVDTPETKGAKELHECLGQEATDFLRARLPAGTEIDLEFDEEREDQYGRTLAAVYHGDSLVNAEIAREGLGAAVVYEPNVKYYQEVLAAQHAAQAAEVGLYDPNVECTLPATVERVMSALEEAPTELATDSAAAASTVTAATTLVNLGEELEATLAKIDASKGSLLALLYATQTDTYRTRLAPALEQADQLRVEHEERLAHLQAEDARRVEEARLAEEARVAEEARIAEEARWAQEARWAEEARQAAAAQQWENSPNTTQTTNSQPNNTTNESSDPYPGYNGPRCYAPGGKTWVPCP